MGRHLRAALAAAVCVSLLATLAAAAEGDGPRVVKVDGAVAVESTDRSFASESEGQAQLSNGWFGGGGKGFAPISNIIRHLFARKTGAGDDTSTTELDGSTTKDILTAGGSTSGTSSTGGTLAPSTAPPTTPPTTVPPTTVPPTTVPPTTVPPTTVPPTTVPPTTVPPTTQAPTTQAPTTQAPTTQAPTTQAPTTQAPTTQAPTTQAPTTQAPTTQAPTTQTTLATAAPTAAPVYPAVRTHESCSGRQGELFRDPFTGVTGCQVPAGAASTIVCYEEHSGQVSTVMVCQLAGLPNCTLLGLLDEHP